MRLDSSGPHKRGETAVATLYERLTGVGLGSEAGGKMSIHAFVAMVFEVHRGKFTGGEAATLFDLTQDQITTVQTFVSYVNAAPNKELFMRTFKDCAYLAESGIAYLTQNEFVSRLQEEIVDQGGTVP
jgi:hypothetical protein